jgi:GNAT superfamily N-acetyltransferase
MNPNKRERARQWHWRCGLSVRRGGQHSARAQVLGQLTNPDIYVNEADERQFVSQHCGPAGLTLGVFDGPTLVAYAMLGLPTAHAADNLGHWFGLNLSDRAKVAHLASCMVLPSHQGFGLQRKLLAARFKLALPNRRNICIGMIFAAQPHQPPEPAARRVSHRLGRPPVRARKTLVYTDLIHAMALDTSPGAQCAEWPAWIFAAQC